MIKIWLKLCMQVAYQAPLIVCYYMAFEIKVQTKAAAAFKGISYVY